MIVNDIEVMFGGQAGDGSLTTGDLIASVFKRMGLEVYTYKDFPSRIRGGHTNYVIRANTHPNYGMADYVDCLAAFDVEAVKLHLDEMRPGGFIIFDNTSEQLTDDLRRPDVTYYEIPLERIAKQDLQLGIVRNTISIGVIAELVGVDMQFVRNEIAKVYGRKGEKVVDINTRAVEAGAAYIREHYGSKPSGYHLEPGVDGERVIMMGNDAIAYGALVAGCRFMAGYPITPATDVLEWMAKYAPRYGGVTIQAEDELAAINMTVAAAFTGVRAMTATSGPGLSLMTEGIGLAGSVEIPIVVIECARAGPSTGLPTKTEQSNLNHLIFGGHGEIPKIVIAPGTVEEAFYLTIDAFNLAEKYQMPVFVLSEQAMCQSKATMPVLQFDELAVDRGKLVTDPVVFGEYKRYAFTDDGVSPRIIPGVEGGMHLVAGSEHNDAGVITENAANRKRMMEKRFKKLETAAKDLPPPLVHRTPGAKIGIIGYGSNRGPIAEAQRRLGEAGTPVDFLQLRTLWPFPEADVQQFVDEHEHVFIVEHSFTGQIVRLIKNVVGPLPKLHPTLKYNGKPYRPIEIIDAVERLAVRPLAKV